MIQHRIGKEYGVAGAEKESRRAMGCGGHNDYI